jgi:nucleotide-binding universal stress UspA family protein
MVMDKRILIGVDMDFSLATRQALHAVSELLKQCSPCLGLILLTVIPVPYTASPSPGSWGVSLRPLPPTIEQRTEAEQALRKARAALQQQGILAECVEMLMRVGVPADEIVKEAEELQVDCIVIGSRGNSLGQRLRRLLVSSTSRRVLHHAPCPVLLVVLPRRQRRSDLVAWYEAAITRSLHEHPDHLTILTPHEVAHLFVPPTTNAVGRKEINVAALALEHLASSGVLFRHAVKGELRYVND